LNGKDARGGELRAEPDPGPQRGKHAAAVRTPAEKEEIRKHAQELLSDDDSVRAASRTSPDVLLRALNPIAEVKRVFPKSRK
jgi:hypothetical protein